VLLVDANVVAYLLIEGAKTAQARALWAIDNDWQAPRLLFYELANVFAQLAKQGAVSLEMAIAGLESAAGLVLLRDQDPPAARILEIVSKLGTSAYDATYLAAAEVVGAPLVTEDRRLLRAAPGITRSLDSLTASE
jgi:predicted nucleic acid-binding protein